MQVIHRLIGQGKRLLSAKIVRKLLLISVAILVIFPVINLLIVYPAFTKFLISATEDQAIRLARHLEAEYLATENE